MDDKRKMLIDAFVRNPTTYTISVRKNGMLPEGMKNRKEISFVIKPPTTHVLALAASTMAELPSDILNSQDVDANEAMKYQDQIARVLSILSFEGTDYPDWYVPFILQNVPTITLLQIMQETSIKCSPGFFLNCLQVASTSNPMMMNKRTMTDSTPGDS